MSTGSQEASNSLLLLPSHQVERILRAVALGPAMEKALVAYSVQEARAPARVAAGGRSGVLAAMVGYVPGTALVTKLISIFPGNTLASRPSHQGLVALFDEADGRVLCIMDGRALTAERTAAVSILSVARLAPEGGTTLAILGSGVQAASHLRAACQLRPWDRIRIGARDLYRARALAAPHPNAAATTSFAEAVRGADVVIMCTDSASPVVEDAWITEGCHVVSVGSGAELPPALVARSSVFVEWRGAAGAQPPAGARELQHLAEGSVTELGAVLAGTRPGRTSRAETTVFKSTGLAVEDAAAARAVYDVALELGVGTRIEW